MMSTVYQTTETRALRIAEAAHDGQEYGEGEPYIVHPLAVAELARSLGYPVQIIIACLLHDVVKDSDITLEDLRDEGFSEFVTSAVEAVTYTKEDKEAGISKAEKAKRHIGGHVVKFCDGLRNLAATIEGARMAGRTTTEKRLGKYVPLVEELRKDLPSPEAIRRALGETVWS